MSDQFVYFIRSEGGVGPVKIGCAANPVKRLTQLQAASPAKLEIVASAEGGFDAERYLHRQFSSQRLHGEWFDVTAELCAVIVYARENGKILPLPEPILSNNVVSFDLNFNRRSKPACEIRAARRSLGLTQAALAKSLGVNHSIISKMESGAMRTSRRTLLAVEALLVRAGIAA